MKKRGKEKRKENKTFIFILYLVVGVVIFLPSLSGTFIFDDRGVLNDAKKFKSISNYFHTIKTSRKSFRNRDSYAFWVLFLTEYRLFGENPLGYKLVNLLFHILAAFVFFLFLKRILIIKFSNDKQKTNDWFFYFPFLGGLLFLVHPLVCEAVSYISGMNNGIGGFFFILGSLLFVLFLEKDETKEKALYFIESIACFILSFFFKEVYLVFPIFLVFLYLFLKPLTRRRMIGAIFIIVLFLLFSGLATVYLPISPFTKVKKVVYSLSYKLEVKAIATNLNAIVYSFYLGIFPKNLNIDHDLPLINTLFDWHVIMAFLIIVLLFFFFFRFKSKLPLSLFAYLSYLLLMAPSNSFILRGLKINGYDILSERNLYAPLFFFVIILLEFLWLLSGRNVKKFKQYTILLIVIFGLRTFVRNFDFRNDLTIWKASLKYSSGRVRPNYNYAVALKDVGRYEEAIPYARRALKISPSSSTLGLLANLYKSIGNNSQYVSLLQNALEKEEFQTAILYHQLGEYYYEHGDFDKAERYFLLAIKKKKGYVLPRLSIVFMYLAEGELDKAKRHIQMLQWVARTRKYTYLDGVYIDDVILSRIAFAEALYFFALKNEKKGVEKCKEAIKLNPEFTEPYLKLGEYYFLKRDDKKALYYLKKAESTPSFSKYKPQVEKMIEQILKTDKIN